MNVETGRLLLREYTMDDIGSLHAILSDSNTMNFWPQPFNLEDTRHWIEKSIRGYHERRHGRWAVLLKENNKFIGDAGILFSPRLVTRLFTISVT